MKGHIWIVEAKAKFDGEWQAVEFNSTRASARDTARGLKLFHQWMVRVVKYIREA